jgi:hypothetical protein
VTLRIRTFGTHDEKKHPENHEREPRLAALKGTFAHYRTPNGVAAIHVCVRLVPRFSTLTWY